MAYRAVFFMDIGLRDNQEDCLLVDGQIIQKDRFDATGIIKVETSQPVFAVCDGMGGHERGEWASRFLCEKTGSLTPQMFSPQEKIHSVFRHIQKDMEKQGVRNSGSTIAGVFLNGSDAVIFNAGDSRVYKITEDAIIYMSHDHSMVQRLEDEGIISREDRRSHPYRNVIEFGFGDVFSREWQGNAQKIFIRNDLLNSGEYYLLCTDGVNDILDDDELFNCLSNNPFDNTGKLKDMLYGKIKDNASFIILGTG